MEAHPIDIHVGKKVRSRRTILGRSQEEIGSAVGITFQQIQKYERGLNRIGSSRLYEFSRLLGVSVGYFFEDVESNGEPANSSALAEGAFQFEHEIIDNKEVLSLVRAYYGINSPTIRKKMLSLIKSLSDAKDDDDSATPSNSEKEPRFEKV